MTNQRQNLGILSEKKVRFKRNVLPITKLVEQGDRGRQEFEGTPLCLLCSVTQLWANTDRFVFMIYCCPVCTHTSVF